MASEAKPKVRSELRNTPSNLAGSEMEVTSHEGNLVLKAVTSNWHVKTTTQVVHPTQNAVCVRFS